VVTLVVGGGVSNILSMNCIRGCLGDSFVWGFVDEDFCTCRGSYGGFVEIEGTIELCIGGKFWVDVGWV